MRLVAFIYNCVHERNASVEIYPAGIGYVYSVHSGEALMAKAKTVAGIDVRSSVSENARLLARARLDEVYEWGQYVDESFRVKELHDLRIAVKRLRYTLELFSEQLPDYCREAITEVTRLQDELGALHDDDVMIALLRLCLGVYGGGAGYEQMFRNLKPDTIKKYDLLQPEMVVALLQAPSLTSTETRYGLEKLLHHYERLREQHYTVFKHHWDTMQRQNFRVRLSQALLSQRSSAQ